MEAWFSPAGTPSGGGAWAQERLPSAPAQAGRGRTRGRGAGSARGLRAPHQQALPHRKRFLATEPLKALVIGAFVPGVSMRDVEPLCKEAGSGAGL